MTTTDAIRQFILDDLGWEGGPSRLTDDLPLLDSEVLDSMGIHQLVAFLEDEFDIEVADEDLAVENFESIAAVSRLVESKLTPDA